MNLSLLPVFALAALPISCAEMSDDDRVLCHAFEVDQRSLRDKLVGRWRSARERVAFLSNGKFTAGPRSGCWEVIEGGSGAHIVFVMGCVTYGSEQILAVAEPSAQCTFTLGQNLALRDCEFAGEYRRE